MLSYQHGYHAGNLADLHKHSVLVSLWHVLKNKPRPLSFVDLQAGRGFYPMGDEFALKTGEQAEGIGAYQGGALLFDEALKKARETFGAEIYPGSPALIAAIAGDDDRLVLAEMHKQEYAALKKNMKNYAEIHQRDGYEMAEALAPFKPRRGLVLIDPSYEVKAEYEHIPKACGRILRKWPEAVIMIWYPILADGRHKAMVKKLETQGEFRSEIRFAKSALRMQGSGVLVINAPFGMREIVQKDLEAFGGFLSQKR